MNKYLKIALTGLPILSAIAGIGIFLVTKIYSSNNTLDLDITPNTEVDSVTTVTPNKPGEIGSRVHPQLQPNQGEGVILGGTDGGVGSIQPLHPGEVKYVPVNPLHSAKRPPIFTPNVKINSEISRSYQNIGIFPDIEISEIYKYIRIDHRFISLDEK